MNTENSIKYLDFCHQLANAADKISMPSFIGQKNLTIEKKSDGSFVTQADKQIEEHLSGMINSKFPSHGFFGEETAHKNAESDFKWIIDPIDGTHGFMRGMPIWATLIALEYNQQIITSMISAPALGSRWWAAKNHGAFKSFKEQISKIEVSTISQISESHILFTGIKECLKKWPKFQIILNQAWRERGLGDFWGHCLVAEGVAESMIDPIVNIWDVAALHLLVSEAGGTMTNESGIKSYTSGHAISSNKSIHSKIIATLTNL